MTITSVSNPRVKSLVALRQRRERQEAGLTLVEGYEELSLAVEAGARPHTVYYCPELASEDESELLAGIRKQGGSVVMVSKQVFSKVAYRQSPDGWLGVLPAPGISLPNRVPANPFLLVCESVEKPGNLGAMLRTADAAGIDAVISANGITDWGNPNVIRASKGTVFSVPVAEANTAAALEWLRGKSITIVATTPDADRHYTDADLTGPIAIAVGSEKYGLSEEWLAAADLRVTIPMVGKANSLNVGTSAAIVIYEAVRQRNG